MPNWTEHTNKVIQHARRLEAAPYAGRRVAKVKATPDILLTICTSGLLGAGSQITVDGVPPGATLLSQGYDVLRGVFWLIVDHDSFDMITEDGPIPDVNVTYTANYLPEFDILRG